MRFMVLVKAVKEAGKPPRREDLLEMGRFNDEMQKAGIEILAADGLHESAQAVRITFDGKKPSVTDGPFTETKELVAGYWLLQAKSKAEVVGCLERAPFRNGESVEIRQIIDLRTFAPDMDDRLRAREERLRQQTEALRR